MEKSVTTYKLPTMKFDEGFNVCLGLVENRLVDLPCVLIQVRVGGEEMVGKAAAAAQLIYLLGW